MRDSGSKTTKSGITCKAITSVPSLLKTAKFTSCTADDTNTTVNGHNNVTEVFNTELYFNKDQISTYK